MIDTLDFGDLVETFTLVIFCFSSLKLFIYFHLFIVKMSFVSCCLERVHNSSVEKKGEHIMEGISLELKVISCRDLKTFNFFQKLSVFVDVSIFIDEPKKNERQRQKTALDFLYGVLKKNEKQRQRLQWQKTPQNSFNDEARKNEQQQLLQRQKTPVAREGGSNPEWNHMMRFDLSTTSLPDYGDHLFIKFELRCQVSIFGNRTIGEVCVPFKDLNEEFNGSVRFLSYQVRDSDGTHNGVLNFSYEVNGKVKKNEVDSPRVDLPPGIRFSSPKKFHYPSSEVDVKSRKPCLYPSLDDISFSSPPPGNRVSFDGVVLSSKAMLCSASASLSRTVSDICCCGSQIVSKSVSIAIDTVSRFISLHYKDS
ncbi:hypothetical protein OIU84_003783 [Salix udensis]|uniref:C2 domain-containing protein n=1 Tax=Salix udensis TaxID=889485 RepID=A0AAD6P3D8_9ROSI|nr:hypothetical protein OIU84_003783 [Salix udensis]